MFTRRYPENPATMHNHALAYRVLSNCAAADFHKTEAAPPRTRAPDSLLEFLQGL